MNDNLYNGRDLMDGTDTAALYGAGTGLVGKGVGKLGEMSKGTALDVEIGGGKPKVNIDADMELGGKPKVNADDGIPKTTIAERRLGEGQYKTHMSDADVKMRTMEDVKANRSMNEVRKMNKISEEMTAIEKSNPRNYQSDPKYQELSQKFDAQSKVVREDKVAIDRMNAIQGEKGADLVNRYNKYDSAYEKKVLNARDEGLAQSSGLNRDQIGDFNVTSNKPGVAQAHHDTDTSPHVKTSDGKTVDFTQTDGQHELTKAVYRTEYGRNPQTAAEYQRAVELTQKRDFTNVSTRPSDTHESYRNPDAYVGSGKGEVNKVLEPGKYGTPDKGTGVFNEQTALHKQGTSYERAQQQWAEAQNLTNRLKTDTSLSAAEKTEMGKKVADLQKQWASNQYESIRTTAKEAKIIKGIDDVNVSNGKQSGISSDAALISDLSNKVKSGEMDRATYKSIVTELYGSEKNAQKIVASGFRTTNK